MMQPSRIGLIAVALLVGVGCAGATAKPGKQYAQNGVLPVPPVLVVYDFAVDASSVMVDTSQYDRLEEEAGRVKDEELVDERGT